jgi:HEPN domain-containing protein
MAMPMDADARRYYRVAMKRLGEAELIFNKLNLAHASVYLAGYAIECIVKALIVVRTEVASRGSMLNTLKTDKRFGHNLRGLRAALVQRGVALPRSVATEFLFASTWSEQMRYDPSERDLPDAEKFLKAARTIVAWADRSM